MGEESKKKKAVIPLPAPTETSSTTASEVSASDVSCPADEKSSYSLPEDGTPVTIKTRGHGGANRSQTSLLIEYYEGSKAPSTESGLTNRRPSVRVRVKSGSARNEHIMISSKSKTGSNRKSSASRRSASGQKPSSSSTALRDMETQGGSVISGVSAADVEDNKSIESYASATEESNVSRNPIVVEIDRGGSGIGIQRHRGPRPTSPLIPNAATSSRGSASFIQGTQSEISAIPADSFLDGETRSPDRAESPSRAFAAAQASAAAAAGAAALERNRHTSMTSRGDDKERVSVSKSAKDRERGRDGGSSSNRERKHRSSRSRASSVHVNEKDEPSAAHRRSSRHRHTESAVSGAVEPSVLSSVMSSHHSYDQYSVRSGASKTSSINNPKLLETVEDAIRRLILPELNALKREQSRRDRRGSTASTGTSVSRDEFGADRRRSGISTSDKAAVGAPRDKDAAKPKEVRDREARHVVEDSLSAAASYDYESGEDASRVAPAVDDTPKKSSEKLKAATAVAEVVVIEQGGSQTAARDQRRRRRAEARSRDLENESASAVDLYLSGSHSAASQSFDGPPAIESELSPTQEQPKASAGYLRPPMPLMSEINSDLTRTSILSAESDRPRSASEERQTAPIQEVPRGIAPAIVGSETSSVAPAAATQNVTLQVLGTQHANVSHGDLKALPRKGPMSEYVGGSSEVSYTSPEQDRELQHDQEYMGQYGRHGESDEYVEYDEIANFGSQTYDEYGNQIVPAPLKYVPYQPEHRGLSPIPSVSGITEGGASEVQGRRDSAVTSTSASSPIKAGVVPDRNIVASPSAAAGSSASHEYDHDVPSSAQSSEISYIAGAQSALTGASNNFRAVEGVGANPNIVHTPFGVESAVASLVDGSMLDGSLLVGDSSLGMQGGYAARGSMETLEEERSQANATPSNRSVQMPGVDASGVGHEQEYGCEMSPISPVRTNPSEFAGEYDLDQYGHKVRQASPTASETAAITAGAVGLAIRAAKGRNQQPQTAEEPHMEGWAPEGVQRNRSFKDRTREGRYPANTPTHSTDRLDEYDERPQMVASGMPDVHDPMPAIGFGYQDSDLETNPSIIHGPAGHAGHEDEDAWRMGDRTPTQEQQNEDEWQRSADDRKRDTLVTNPYEGTSPIVNEDLLKSNPSAPAAAAAAAASAAYNASLDYASRSPLGARYDEGYETQVPGGKSPEAGKGMKISFEGAPPTFGLQDDAFYPGGHAWQFSGLSQGMGSPLYDPATGAGLDRIENKDIIALMQHLMVRDAQRSARDTEILVTLVRAAAEMRTSFENVKTLLAMHEKGLNNDLSKKLADSEDAIITEVLEGTDKTMRAHLGGPRPQPPSGARSLHGGASQAEMDEPAKRQNIFRRALKSLNAKGNNDLTRIEDMLNQLLLQVDTLKAQTRPTMSSSGSNANANAGGRGVSVYGDAESQMPYEQDRGYEPEGHAGTSTASHGSQSGFLSVNSRTGPSARKFSDNRISTVPEANEDEDYGHPRAATPGGIPYSSPGSGVQQAQQQTPQSGGTDKGKKYKSGGSASWLPKISRWSKTTTSSVFRDSRKGMDDGEYASGPSRSGSGLVEGYEGFLATDPEGEDRLHSGFSETDLRGGQYEAPAAPYMTPENPKYHAHRDSLDLQHPQPRSGQPLKATLESRAADFESSMSPRSPEWAGSATSLHRWESPRPASQQSQRSQPSQGAPPRPPKEPLEQVGEQTPPARPTKEPIASPLSMRSVEGNYGTAPLTGSPRLENRNLSSALGVPTRRPSGPRAMTPKSERSVRSYTMDESAAEEARRRKRDTFGTVATRDNGIF